MSTIAYRDGILAADSMLSGDNIVWGSISKIVVSRQGAIGGATGRLDAAQEFMTWLENVQAGELTTPPVVADISAEGLVVTPKLYIAGMVLIWSGGNQLAMIDAPFIAIGSGAKIAMGAMAAGKSAAEAVEIAAKYDIYTGGKIVTLGIDANSSPQTRSIAQ